MDEAQGLTAEEGRAIVERRMDELDRLLLGLLPRAERLALVASVEARVQELGAAVDLGRTLPAEAPIAAVAVGRTTANSRGRRSRLAFSSGVLGIVVASCLVGSPLLLVALSIFGELLGETFSILLFGLLTVLITIGGGIAVFCGGIALLRLARRGQTATGTGWAITGLCTGALPLLIGFVGVLSLGATLLPAEHVRVTWNVDAGGPPTAPMNTPAPVILGSDPLPMSVPADLPTKKPAARLETELLPAAPSGELVEPAESTESVEP